MIRAYLSHAIRGSKGEDATEQDMVDNNQLAIAFADKLRQMWPRLDLYVPAEHDEFVVTAYKMGVLNEDEILDVDTKMLDKRDLLIVFIPDGYTSRGMQVEIAYARTHAIPILCGSEDTCGFIHLEAF